MAAPMPDMMYALESFQDALDADFFDLRPGQLSDDIRWIYDLETGDDRWTFVHIEDGRTTAFATFCPARRFRGQECIQIGYAVPEDLQGQGRASELARAAIDELVLLFRQKSAFDVLYVAAMVSETNIASQRVAAKLFEEGPEPETQGEGGEPMLHYFTRYQIAPLTDEPPPF